MDIVINDFVQVLRRHQVRVSPAESLDALHALEQTGLSERGVVRDTLRTTLVKNLDDIETFARLFDLYFSLRPTVERRTAKLDVHDHGEPPNAAALEEITQHVKQTVWMTPEPKWGWSLGSCDMPLYEPLCDRVEVVRRVDQLAGVAEELVRVRL